MGTLFNMHYYRVTKLFCSMAGIWPYQAQFRKRIIQSFNMIILFSHLPPQLRRLYHVWGKDMDAVCMCIAPLVCILVCVSNNATIILFDKELCNLFVCFIMTPTLSPVLDIVLPCNETRVKNLAFDLDYGIDLQTYWIWLWLHTCMTSGVAILNIISADLIFVTLVIYNCCLFAIARHKLECLADSIEQHALRPICGDRPLNLEEQTIGIKQCVISHKKAIRCAKSLHGIYTWSLFLTLGANLIIISISGIQVVSKLSQWTQMAVSVSYILGQLIHLFFLCLITQFILDHSLYVHESAYSCSWYNMPINIRKDIIFILLRSRTPCSIMAGKLFIMSLENFCLILQTSISYFTVLASFR